MTATRRWRYPAAPPAVERSGRTLVVVGAFGQAYAVLLMAGSWGSYDRPWIVLGCWVAMTAVPVVLTGAAAVRADGTPGPLAVVPAVAVLAASDVVVPALAGPGERLAEGAWNWGAVAIMLLLLSVYRPAAEVLVLTAGHALAVLLWAFVPGPDRPVDPVNLVLVLSGCVIPPLAAAQFVGFYLEGLRRRQDAGHRERDLRARAAAEEAVSVDRQERLARLRADAMPILRDIAEGAPLPLYPERAAAARRVAERLRRELAEGREVDWLLRRQIGADRGDGVDVQVVTGLGASRLLTDEPRAAVAAVVNLLRRHPGWDRITLTMAGAEDGSVALALVAQGEAATVAVQDAAVRAAAAQLCPAAGSPSLDDERTLVLEGRITPGPVAVREVGDGQA